jgi:uncharacterized YigZ family protein
LHNLKFIKQEFNTSIEVKKSKFLSFIVPFNKFKNKLEILKKEHPKARHIVWAYRYLNEHEQIIENSTDDAEPKGVAGKPTLKVLAGHDMINCAILTVRYFGGIKLGMGGMVRAYTDSANAIFENIELFNYEKLEDRQIIIEYSELSQIEYNIKQNSVKIKDIEYSDKIKITVIGTKENLNKIL